MLDSTIANGCDAAGDECRQGCVKTDPPMSMQAFVTIGGRQSKGGSITRSIPVEEVMRGVPVSFLPNVLPAAFADHLLKVFLEEVKTWHTSKRWLYDKEIESHRVESGFRFDASGFGPRWEAAGFGDDLRHMKGVIAAAVQRARGALRQAWRAEHRRPQAGAPTPHELAQEVVALASRGQGLDAQSADWLVRYAYDAAFKGYRWEPNYLVANFYADEHDFLGAHSDPVQSLGPWAVVASLTFGAARQFRMKPVGKIRADGPDGGHVTSYSIRLPHNSLLICWEGFQEFWRHEVPKDAGLQRHPLSGSGRLNFTFRRTVPSVSARRPLCKCGKKANLKPVLKETSRHKGRYFWSCTNPRVRKDEYQTCDFFQWDDERLAERQAEQRAAQRQPFGGGREMPRAVAPVAVGMATLPPELAKPDSLGPGASGSSGFGGCCQARFLMPGNRGPGSSETAMLGSTHMGPSGSSGIGGGCPPRAAPPDSRGMGPSGSSGFGGAGPVRVFMPVPDLPAVRAMPAAGAAG